MTTGASCPNGCAGGVLVHDETHHLAEINAKVHGTVLLVCSAGCGYTLAATKGAP